MINTVELFDLSHTLAYEQIIKYEFPWQILPDIKDIILSIANNLDKNEYNELHHHVWIHDDAVISPNSFIASPCIIGENTEVRQGAFIRGSALIGKNCVIGNSTEIKNSILFDNVQVPHYNYVGDSILGYKAHMGAGSITSNVKSDKTLITVKYGDKSISTGLKKFGAMLGDYSEIGCNAVLNPGTVIGRKSNIYPLSSVRGVVPPESICKSGGVIIKKANR